MSNRKPELLGTTILLSALLNMQYHGQWVSDDRGILFYDEEKEKNTHTKKKIHDFWVKFDWHAKNHNSNLLGWIQRIQSL